MKSFFVFVLVAVLVLGCSREPNSKYIESEIELKPSEIQELLESILVQPEPTIVPEPTSTPEPTVTPPPLVDSRAVVIEELKTFNELNNNTVRLIRETQSIYEFESHPYHKMYIATIMVVRGLEVYKSGLLAWEPSPNEYSRELDEILSAEIYRIDRFQELGIGLMEALQDNNKEGVDLYTEEFNLWGVHPDNKKPMIMQRDLLDLLDIPNGDVNFLYNIPDSEVQEEVPSLLEKSNATM